LLSETMKREKQLKIMKRQSDYQKWHIKKNERCLYQWTNRHALYPCCQKSLTTKKMSGFLILFFLLKIFINYWF